MYPPNAMESIRSVNVERDASLRRQDTMKRSFQRRLQYFKDSLTSCYLVYSKCYTLQNNKKRRLDHGIRLPILYALDEYFWFHMTHAENFYGLGMYNNQYILFSFKYDMLDEPNVKIIVADTREALIKEAMHERMYNRYIKDTSPM
jgi:hypothetical protein